MALQPFHRERQAESDYEIDHRRDEVGLDGAFEVLAGDLETIEQVVGATPLELIDLAALIPPLRLHRHRYHGVLAPSAPLPAEVGLRWNSSRLNNEILDYITVRLWPRPDHR